MSQLIDDSLVVHRVGLHGFRRIQLGRGFASIFAYIARMRAIFE
jgi:hypothetical protein